MDSSQLKTEVETIIKEELRPLAVKAEPALKAEATPAISLAIVRGRTLEPAKVEPAEEPGLAGCPLAFAPEAQVAALAPVQEDEDEEDEEPAASQSARVASISAVPFKREYRDQPEPAPPGEEPEDDPFGLGPRRSRSPPASRAQLRSLAATASQKPRKKTSFYHTR